MGYHDQSESLPEDFLLAGLPDLDLLLEEDLDLLLAADLADLENN